MYQYNAVVTTAITITALMYQYNAVVTTATTITAPMYQYNDRLTQLFIKYKYIWLWLQCFDPYLGHRQAYIMNLEGVVHV
jgi:hypothetical protein